MILNGKEYKYGHCGGFGGDGGDYYHLSGDELLENANEDDLKYIGSYFGGDLDVDFICSKMIGVGIYNDVWFIFHYFSKR